MRRILRASPVQPKVAVGPPGDRYEREADTVADHVVAGRPAPPISRLPPAGIPPTTQRQPDGIEEEEPVQTLLIQRQSRDDELDEPIQKQSVQRQEATFEEDEPVQAKGGSIASSSSMSSVAQAAIDNKGAGRPLDPGTRSTLESGMGADLSGVRVHDDSAAHQAAHGLGARAFTHGSDIWLGRGESAGDTRLMAHEATHVVQQSGAVQRNVVQRNEVSGDDGGDGDGDEVAEIDLTALPEATGRLRAPSEGTDKPTIVFSEIDIPPFKLSGHRGALHSRPLKRQANYKRNDPDPRQRQKWKREVDTTRIRHMLSDKIKRTFGVPSVDESANYIFERPLARSSGEANAFVLGKLDEIASELTIPMWGHANRRPDPVSYQVDHIVELQLANWSDDRDGNDLANMELLEEGLNTSSGGSIRAAIDRKVEQFREASGNQLELSKNEIKRRYYLEFERAVAGGGPARANRDDYWTRSEVESGSHLRAIHARNASALGGEGTVLVFRATHGGQPQEFGWPGALSRREREFLDPFEITAKNFVTEGDDIEETDGFGSFTVNIPEDHPNWKSVPDEPIDIDRVPGARYAGRIRAESVLRKLRRDLKLKGMSPIRVDTFEMLPDAGISVTGAVLPQLPLLGDDGISFELHDGRLRIYKEFVGDELEVPPPFTIRNTSLTIFAETGTGLGAEGRVDFGIDNVGEGFAGGFIATDGTLGFAGGFDFDSELFDEAHIELGYEQGVFRGSGVLSVGEDKVAGVNSASIDINVEGESISGTGTVEPKIRAIREGTVTYSQSPEEGTTIGGSLELSDEIPNVDGGSVSVEIHKAPEAEGYDLKAHGEVQAGLPGIAATLTVDYENGLFTVEGRGDYERGMLSGSVLVGATNRAVDAEGNFGDELGDHVIAYGGGTVTVGIAPWLQATAGIRLLPNGEIELAGEIGLPDVLEIFPERTYERNIFSISLDIPIIGVAVAGQRIGIFASIGGGLDLAAGVGPGQLQELGLRITYNPDHEDQTHVEGGAKLVIPAHAGLRLFVRASIGAGIPVVSAELGLEIGGQLGLEGALEMGVEVDWTPVTGLVLDALAEIYVEPKFRFDITGFAEVTADLFITEITLFEKRWELVAIEIGSDYRLGMKFPYHQEGDVAPEIDWNSVEFEIPDVDASEILSSLVDRIT